MVVITLPSLKLLDDVDPQVLAFVFTDTLVVFVCRSSLSVSSLGSCAAECLHSLIPCINIGCDLIQ